MALKIKPVSPREVQTRWTPDLVADGWTPVSDFFLRNYHRIGITSNEAMLVVHLMTHKWDAHSPYPGFTSLAKRMGIGATQVRNHARSLEAKGCLHRVIRTGTTNRFVLTPLFMKLEALRAADHAAREQTPPAATESATA